METEIGNKTNELYSVPVVRKMIEVEELERSVCDYYILLNNLNTIEMVSEIKRIKELLGKHKDNLNLCLKLGIVEYFLAFMFHNNVCFIEDHLKYMTKEEETNELDPKKFFSKAKEFDPYNENILYCQAMYCLRKGDIDEFSIQKKLLETHHPKSLWFLLIKGREFEEKDEYEKVISYYEETLDLFPNEHVSRMYALRSIFRAAEKMKQKNIQLKYIRMFNESMWGKISTSGHSSLAFFSVSEFFFDYEEHGGRVSGSAWSKLEDAIYIYENECLKISTNHIYYYMAFVHYIREEKKKCLEYIEKELETNPYSVSTLQLRVTVCTEPDPEFPTTEEDFDTAISDIQRIIQMEPTNEEIIETKKKLFEEYGVEKVLRCIGFQRFRPDLKERIQFMMKDEDYEVIDLVSILDVGIIRTLKFFIENRIIQ